LYLQGINMSVTFITTAKRKDLDFDWFEESAEFTEYVTEKYVKTGKCLQWRKPEVSDDQRTLTLTSIWIDIESALNATTDPYVRSNRAEMTRYGMFADIELSDNSNHL